MLSKERLQALPKKGINRQQTDAFYAMCAALSAMIDAAVRRKIEINKTRPWKHGKE